MEPTNPTTLSERLQSPRLNWLNGVSLALFVGCVSWSATRIVDSYRDVGVTTARIDDRGECMAQLMMLRNRELDDVKMRLHDAETSPRMCPCGAQRE